MKRYLTVTVQRSANHKPEEHRLKPQQALEKYRELKATQKRVWPKVEITEFVDRGEPSEVAVLEDEGLLAVVTAKRVYVQREGEAVKTLVEKKAKQKKKKSKKSKK